MLITSRDDLEEQIGVSVVVGKIAKFVNLCGAQHKLTNVQYLVMWSWPEKPVFLGATETLVCT